MNEMIVVDTGEPFHLLKPYELESAIAKPWNQWYYNKQNSMAVLATTLMVGLAKNHPFQQGNKRTAFQAALIFFQNNGLYLDHPDDDEFGLMIEQVIEGLTSENDLALELNQYLVETLI